MSHPVWTVFSQLRRFALMHIVRTKLGVNRWLVGVDFCCLVFGVLLWASCEPMSPSARDMGTRVSCWGWKRANTGVSPLRCASVEMTGLRCGCAFGCEPRSPKARGLGRPDCAGVEESQYRDLSTTAQKRASGRDDKGRSGWRRTVAFSMPYHLILYAQFSGQHLSVSPCSARCRAEEAAGSCPGAG